VSSASYVDFEITPRLLVMDNGDRAIEMHLHIDGVKKPSAEPKLLTKEQLDSLSGELSEFSDEQAQRIGELVMPPPFLIEFRRLRRAGKKIRIAIKVPSTMLAVRWEAAYVDPLGFLTKVEDVSLVRRAHSRTAIGEILFPKRVKYVARMDATDWTRDDDLREIKSDCPSNKWVNRFGGDCIPYDVHATQSGLDQYTASTTPTAIFHFSGHGAPDGGVFIEPHANGDEPAEWTSDKIRDQLAAHDVRLAVMSACQSGEAANKIFVGLSPKLAEVIPAVIGMHDRVRQKTASRFTRAMYDRLAEGGDLDEAVFDGRQVLARRIGYDFAIPVLYLQVTGDTRMMPDAGHEEATAESNVPVPRTEAVASTTPAPAPPIAVGVGDRVWWLVEDDGNAGLRDAGNLAGEGIYPPPEDAFGLATVISADGKTVATKRANRLELRRLRVTADNELEFGAGTLVDIPFGLENARLLSVRAALGAVQFIVADDNEGALGLTLRTGHWSTPVRFGTATAATAVAAADTTHGVIIGRAKGVAERHEGPGTGFPGFSAITGVDSVIVRGSSVVLVSGVAVMGGAPRFRLERRAVSGSTEVDVEATTIDSYVVLVRDLSGQRATLLSVHPESGHVTILDA
jgi:hypothetical protein